MKPAKKPWELSPEELKANREASNEAATDWHAVCPVCHTELTGTLKQLREHVCDVHPR